MTAPLTGGADVDLTDIGIPDGAELRITKPSLIGGVKLRVRHDIRVEVHGLRLGGVNDHGPSEPGGPTVRIDAWGPARRCHRPPRAGRSAAADGGPAGARATGRWRGYRRVAVFPVGGRWDRYWSVTFSSLLGVPAPTPVSLSAVAAPVSAEETWAGAASGCAAR